MCWGAQSTSGPTKTEMLNGPFPKVKVWKGLQHKLPPLTLSAGPGTLVGQHLCARAHSPGIRPAPGLGDTQGGDRLCRPVDAALQP